MRLTFLRLSLVSGSTGAVAILAAAILGIGGPAPTTAHAQAAPVVITRIDLGGFSGAVTITNLGPDTINLDSWWLCQQPDYWPFPNVDLAPNASLVISAAGGDDTNTTLFANGAYGGLNGDHGGEVGLYIDQDFSSAASLADFVAWNDGGSRIGVGRAAGLWGQDDLPANAGDTLIRERFDVNGAAAWVPPPADDAPVPAIEELPRTGSGGLADQSSNGFPAWVIALTATGLFLVGGVALRQSATRRRVSHSSTQASRNNAGRPPNTTRISETELHRSVHSGNRRVHLSLRERRPDNHQHGANRTGHQGRAPERPPHPPDGRAPAKHGGP